MKGHLPTSDIAQNVVADDFRQVMLLLAGLASHKLCRG